MSVTPSTKRKAFTVFLVIWAIFYAIVAIEDTVMYAPDWYTKSGVVSNLFTLFVMVALSIGVYLSKQFEKAENIYIQEGTERNELIAKLHKDIDSLVEALEDESPQEREYIPAALRKYITERDRCTCFYCGKVGTRRHDHRKRTWNIDHLLPISRGGSNAPSNLVLACENCNLSKNDKTAAEFFYYKYGRYIRQEEQAAAKKQ